jgi:hypothetical protein
MGVIDAAAMVHAYFGGVAWKERVYKFPWWALLPTHPQPHTSHAMWRSGQAVINRLALSDVRNPAAELCGTTCSIRGCITFFSFHICSIACGKQRPAAFLP